ncbi:peptidase inhibitor family I36 protein [Nonomuraea sp. KM88]|uniref:peptidase inhibitor family I36 protein n=1 Tax=Nonomuraea sp. KM88 TaxID=3457427 RepID=UPI003FCDDEF2
MEAQALDCPVGRICLWQGANFTGLKMVAPETAPGSCRWTAVPYQSAYNRTGALQRLWQNTDCTGANRYLPSGSAIDQVGGFKSVGG